MDRDGLRPSCSPSRGALHRLLVARDHAVFQLERKLRDGHCGRAAGRGLHEQLAAHDGLAHCWVGRNIAHMHQLDGSPGFCWHKPVQNLLQLHGNGALEFAGYLRITRMTALAFFNAGRVSNPASVNTSPPSFHQK